ncbi:MAG: lipoprotein [Burkholderiales bacterium]|nr:lipoprotein [Burkholderiales bacterium]
MLLACLLAGCGHRGPLYLPGKPGDPALGRQSRVVVPPAAGATAPRQDTRTLDEEESR